MGEGSGAQREGLGDLTAWGEVEVGGRPPGEETTERRAPGRAPSSGLALPAGGRLELGGVGGKRWLCGLFFIIRNLQ